MKFKYTILYVDDVVETFSFYEKAFGLQKKMLHESGEYGELDTGSTTLSFSSLKLMKELGKNPAKPNLKAPTFKAALDTGYVKKI